MSMFSLILFPCGILAFLVARNRVENNRRRLMTQRREIEEEARLEIEAERAAGKNVTYYTFTNKRTLGLNYHRLVNYLDYF